MSEKKRGKLIAFLFLVILGICWFEPIVWLITNSFKFDSDFITSFANIQGPMDYLTRLIPRQWTISNYTELFFGGENVNTNSNIGLMFQNSFIVSITVTVFTVFITSLSAYAYERLNFKGGDKIWDALRKKLGINEGECTSDGRFSLDSCRCIGACGMAPVMMINDDVYGRLTVDQLDSILEKYN